MVKSTKEKLIEEGKFFAVISYISFLCIVSLVLKKDNDFALYHAKTGLVLFVFEVVIFLATIISFLWWLKITGMLVFTLVSLWGIFQASMGKYNRILLVSDIADKIVL